MQHRTKTTTILKPKTCTVNLTVPTAYSKLTKKQVLALCAWFVRKVPNMYLTQRALFMLTGLKPLPKQHVNKEKGNLVQAYKYRKEVIWIDVAKLPDLLQKLDWIFNKIDLVKPVCKRLLFRHAPSEALYNTIWGEYISADIESFHFSTTGKIKHLNYLCNILYRQGKTHAQKSHKSFDGDVRVAFNSNTYKRGAWRWNFVSKAKRYSVYLYFAGCKASLEPKFPNVFNNTVSSSTPIHPGESYLKSTTVLSGDDATKVDALYKTKTYIALETLDSILAKASKNK